MVDGNFLQNGFDKKLSHAIEEVGEFLAAAGKTQRWGLDSYNPYLPENERETNFEWLYRELEDALQTLSRLKYEMFLMKEENNG